MKRTMLAPSGISTATQAALDAKAASYPLTSGEEVIPRSLLSNAGVAINSGSLRLTYFTARKTGTSTQGRMYTGAAAAAATPTLCRWGLYSIAGNGDGTLVASIASDTTLFAAANTGYLRSWSSAPSITAGQRYAWGLIVVSSQTVPSFIGGGSNGSGFGTIAATDPRLTGFMSGQTDLPSSFTSASVAAGANFIYAELLP